MNEIPVFELHLNYIVYKVYENGEVKQSPSNFAHVIINRLQRYKYGELNDKLQNS